MRSIHILAFAVMMLIVGRANAVTSASSLRTVFDLDSTKSTYPFAMRLQGTMELQGDLIVIEVHGGVIRSAIPAHLGDLGVGPDVQIAFGLGEKTKNGWTTSHDTSAQIVAPGLSPGETRSVRPLRFVIDNIRGVPIRDRWLAASLGVTQRLPGLPAGPPWSYACAQDNLLGVTAASRRRAKLMQAAYSKTC